MLYDPKWEQQTKANPLTLENLIAWLERQPCNGYYDFNQFNNCLLARWLHSFDPAARNEMDNAPSGFFYTVNGQLVNLSRFGEVARGEGRAATFGAALKRARAAITS